VTSDLLSLLIGVCAAIVTILVLQLWPVRYSWSEDVSRTVGDPSGRPLYRAKLFRPRRLLFRNRRNPIDASFGARVAVTGLGRFQNYEKIVEIPVHREWLPSLGTLVHLWLRPDQCDVRDLREFPDEIKDACLRQELTLEALLSSGTDAVLRVYVFAYRPYMGTRWTVRRKYVAADVRAGYFTPDRGVVDTSTAVGGVPPPSDDPGP
jgi:hypothetical protein